MDTQVEKEHEREKHERVWKQRKKNRERYALSAS